MAVGSLLILPGDGIGPEVMDEVCRIIEWFEKKLDIEFEKKFDDVGGAAYDRYGTPLSCLLYTSPSPRD